MTNNEFVEKLQKREDELIRICIYNGVYDNDSIKELIQELYYKLLLFNNINKYVKDDDINMYIIFAIIRNMIYDNSKKLKLEELDKHYDIPADETIEYDNDKYNFIKEEIENIDNWYDKMLIKIFYGEEHTIRSFSNATKIKIHYIHPVIKKFKDNCIKKYKKNKK